VFAVAACGSTPRPPAPPVRLSIAGPADGTTTLSAQVLVRGTVAPSVASVLVGGKPAGVSAGSFSTWVKVAPGTNVIDVLAGAPHARDAMSAVRVYRELPVRLPDVSGESASDAARTLRRLGLRAQIQDGGGFFQSLLPFVAKSVCATRPAAQSMLAPGSTVTLQIGRFC
jgi:hypothetical protein